jgi:hypothetical protein
MFIVILTKELNQQISEVPKWLELDTDVLMRVIKILATDHDKEKQNEIEEQRNRFMELGKKMGWI